MNHAIIPHNGRALYWLHFPEGLIETQNPGNLLIDNITMDFTALEELHNTSSKIYELIRAEKPDLVIAFAHGGIPIAMSVINRFINSGEQSSDYRFAAQRPFHIFPGLNWTQVTPSGLSTVELFAREFKLLIDNLNKGEVKIFAIDTTTRGNAPNRIWKCMKPVIMGLDGNVKIDLRIMAIVGMGNTNNPPGQAVKIGLYQGIEVQLLVPDIWDNLSEDEPFIFQGEPGEISQMRVCFHYFPVASLLSEDNEKLIGYQQVSQGLKLVPIPFRAQLIAKLPLGGTLPLASKDSISKVFVGLLSGWNERFFNECRRSNERINQYSHDPCPQNVIQEITKGIVQEWLIDEGGDSQLDEEALNYRGKLPPLTLYSIFKHSCCRKLMKKVRDSLVSLSDEDRAALAGYAVSYFSEINPKPKPTGIDPLAKIEDQLECWLRAI